MQTATMADFITLDLVKGHLKDMGYDPASISKEALHEFVLELQDIYTERLLRKSKTDADSTKSTSIPDNSERHSLHPHSNIKSESLKLDSTSGDDDSEYFDAYSRDLLSHRHGNSSDSEVDLEKWENEVDEMTEEQLLDKLRQINLKRTANLSTSTYSNRLDSSTISGHPIRITNAYRGPLNPPTFKKHDPVTLYHQHQARWKKDRFLNRIERRGGPQFTNEPKKSDV